MQPVKLRTPDSADILIGAASNAATERRYNNNNNSHNNNKSFMKCLRDRTPSYYNNNQHHQHHHQQQQHYNQRAPVRYENGANRPDAAHQAAPRPRPRPNKLAVLKSSSTRDLSRLIEEDQINGVGGSGPASNFSSSSSMLSMSVGCDSACARRMHELEKRLALLEKEASDLGAYTKTLESKVVELTRRIDESQLASKNQKKSSKSTKQTSTAATSVQPSKFVAWMNLSNLWKHRPSIQSLKEQNIYNDEPCFDTEIELVLKHEVHRTVPKIVVDCCDLIEEKFRQSPNAIEGIYRQCGDYNKIQTLRFSIDANDYTSLRQPNIEIHTLTGVLKLFLREIKSPLVRTNEAKTFIGKPNQWLLTPLPLKIETLKRLIRSLPEVNRDTMEYLFKHFHRLTKVPLQSVSAETLSLSVTPSIFHTVQQGVHTQDIHVLLKESEVLADCVKIMIEYHGRIFECTAERRKSRLLDVRKLRKTLSHPDLLFQNLF